MTVASAEPDTGDARLRVMAARVIAQQRWPYVSTLLFTLRLVEVPHDQLATMAVDDGWRMYYSPQFVMQEAPEALATVLLHEAMHCLHQHGARFEALHQPPSLHPLWNMAGDAFINETLDEAKMPWPSVEPVRYSTLTSYGVTEESTPTILERVDRHQPQPTRVIERLADDLAPDLGIGRQLAFDKSDRALRIDDHHISGADITLKLPASHRLTKDARHKSRV